LLLGRPPGLLALVFGEALGLFLRLYHRPIVLGAARLGEGHQFPLRELVHEAGRQLARDLRERPGLRLCRNGVMRGRPVLDHSVLHALYDLPASLPARVHEILDEELGEAEDGDEDDDDDDYDDDDNDWGDEDGN
jgi:hypothetical protein